jgi:branched-chain amino acid transport system substrate-binding protein
VACFFAGGGAAKFIRDYAAAGLKDKIPLYGSGFLTEGVLDAAGPAADGIITTMHYSDSLPPRNGQFRLNYAKTFKMQPDVYAVQGYDTGLLLIQGANAVKGDLSSKPALYKAMESAVIDSPRGKWTMSPSHNPVQDMYLRRGREQGKQGDRRRRQGAGRLRRRLQDGLIPFDPAQWEVFRPPIFLNGWHGPC